MGMYHFVLFAFRRNDSTFILFGIVCILIAMRATLLEVELANYFFPFLSWEIGSKLEYLGASLGIFFFYALLIHSLQRI